MVGPCRMEFGNVVAAGSIIRKDESRPGRLIQESARKSVNIPFTNGLHLTLRRIMANNITYIANLLALMQWYKQARRLFVGRRFPEALLDGLCQTLDTNIQERVNRLIEYCGLMPVGQPLDSAHAICQNELHLNVSRISDILPALQQIDGEGPFRDNFLKDLQKTIQTKGNDYIAVIQALPANVSEWGTQWLQGIVSQVVSGLTGIFPSLHA